MRILGIAGGVAFTAILVFLAVILYKKATGSCGCTTATPEPSKLGGKLLTIDRSMVTDFGAKKDMVS